MTDGLDRDRLGVLSKLSRGGQGTVYDAPSVRCKFAAAMVYKEYTAQSLKDMDSGALAAMPGFLESLPHDDGARLISIAAWPCKTVEVAGSTTGFVMPKLSDDFFVSLTTVKGPSRALAEFQHLLNPRKFLEQLGISITDEQRCALLREVASGLTFLHRNGVCVGDISPKNLLFCPTPPRVHFIDCDAMQVNDASVLPQADTPNWWTPSGEDKATPYSDTYKLGLLALRLFAGEQHVKDPRSLPETTPALLRHLITDTLTRAPAKRPQPIAWSHVLGRVIEDLQHQEALAATVAADAAAAIPAGESESTTKPVPQPVDHNANMCPVNPPPSPPSVSPPPYPPAPGLAPKSLGWKVFGTVAAAIVGAIALTHLGSTGSSHDTYPTSTTTARYSPSYNTTAPLFTEPPTTTWESPTTSTMTRPPTTAKAPPYWDGIWLRNYWESPADCDMHHSYWVVQPGEGNSGMQQLKLGCFPQTVIDGLNNRSHSLSWWTAVYFAVWDPDRIMSENDKQGNLQLIGLKKSCLALAGITSFHEGPIHDDCLVKPSI